MLHGQASLYLVTGFVRTGKILSQHDSGTHVCYKKYVAPSLRIDTSYATWDTSLICRTFMEEKLAVKTTPKTTLTARA
jgi:hypothetical protein